MTNPKLSIITINLNNASGLRMTIESIVNQTFTDFEYIIIDGGSTDGSLEVIKEFADRITYWVSEPDKGIYNAMNKGINKASGKYCLFLNSGDILTTPGIIDKCFNLNYNEDIIYGNAIFDEKGTFVVNKIPSDITFYDFYRSSIAHPCTFIKRELFNDIGFYNENYKISSDWEFFLKAIFLYKRTLKYLDLEIAVINSEGISRTEIDSGKKERVIILNELFPRFAGDYTKLHNYINSNPGDLTLSTHIKFLNQTKRFQKLVTAIVGFLIFFYKCFRFKKNRTK